MSKDRNTFAKRQRESEKKRKAGEKRDRRAKKKNSPDDNGEPNESPSLVSRAEHSVLSLFRKYLMTPGKMLCLSNADLEVFDVPLAQLTTKGLLVPENSRGGYSLTESGFAVMKDGE
jgi:hypothetical protein